MESRCFGTALELKVRNRCSCVVEERDTRIVALLSHLFELRRKMPRELSPLPESLIQAIENNHDYITSGRYLEHAFDPDHEVGRFKSEKDKYSSVLVPALDQLGQITGDSGARSNRFKNAWWHVWDNPPKPDFISKMVRNIRDIGETSTWTAENWISFIHKNLADKGKLPESLMNLEEFKIRISQTGVLQNAIRSKRSHLLGGLNAMDWKSYVRVEDTQTGKYADDALHDKLCSFNVVEINGVGGLGKTELLYQFLRRHLSGEYGRFLPDFQDYIILTAKSDEQGEIDTLATVEIGDELNKSSPSDPGRGPRNFIKDLKFEDVIRVINTFDSTCVDLSDEDNARKVLHHGNFLLALDNFEDCKEDDRKKFREFFSHPEIARAVNSRIVVTGRDQAFSFSRIVLQVLPPNKAQELFRKRYEYLYKASSTGELSINWKGFQRVLNGFNAKNFPERFEQLCTSEGFANFNHWIGHPLFTFHLTTLLGNEELLTKHGSGNDGTFDLIELLRAFVEDEELELNKLHEKLHAWIIGKAFTDVESDDVALMILKLLLEHNALTEDDLIRLIEPHHESSSLVQDLKNAIKRLVKHDIFLRGTNPLDRDRKAWQLKSDGHRFLSNHPTIQALANKTSVEHKPSDTEGEIQALLHQIDNAVSVDHSAAQEVIHQLNKILDNVALIDKRNLSIETFQLVIRISASLRNLQGFETWKTPHNQAVDALMSFLDRDKYPEGGSRQVTLNLFRQLLLTVNLLTSSNFGL